MKLTEYRSVEPPAKPDRYFPNRVINGPWIAERYLEAATLRQIATLAAKDGTR